MSLSKLKVIYEDINACTRCNLCENRFPEVFYRWRGNPESRLMLIGEALGAPLTGSIFDITGSYRLAFLISIGISAVAVILSLVLLRHEGITGMVRE